MYIIVVYDTLAERNPKVLRTCRQYLHHVQRSVFEGEVSVAQLKRFRAAIEAVIDRTYDSILVYAFPPGTTPQRDQWGTGEPPPSDILLPGRLPIPPPRMHDRRFTAIHRPDTLTFTTLTCDFTIGSSSPLRGAATCRTIS
jgi:CRISPR-associated protein Cas2